MAKLEIACFNVASAFIAKENGADRIEFCAGIKVGGTTPNFEMVQRLRKSLDIEMYVMIRPRGGNFVYTASEFEQMKSDILAAKKCNFDGFVFGILKDDNTVNIEQNKFLVDLAKPLPCTFHRAFDEVLDAFESLEKIIYCGFSTILTSGQKPNVVEGAYELAALVQKANNRIIIMPGGGLRSSNIDFIRQKTKSIFYHSSAITDRDTFADADEIKALKSKLK